MKKSINNKERNIVVRVKNFNSINSYKNSSVESITFINGELIIVPKDTHNKIRVKLPIDWERISTDGELFNIKFNETGVISIANLRIPKNTVKAIYWYYGFRNKHYVQYTRDIMNFAEPNDKLIFESDNIHICAQMKEDGYYTIKLIQIDFANVNQEEINESLEKLNELRITPFTVRYNF